MHWFHCIFNVYIFSEECFFQEDFFREDDFFRGDYFFREYHSFKLQCFGKHGILHYIWLIVCWLFQSALMCAIWPPTARQCMQLS